MNIQKSSALKWLVMLYCDLGWNYFLNNLRKNANESLCKLDVNPYYGGDEFARLCTVCCLLFCEIVFPLQKMSALDVGSYRQLLDDTKSDFTIHPPYDNKEFISQLCQVCH